MNTPEVEQQMMTKVLLDRSMVLLRRKLEFLICHQYEMRIRDVKNHFDRVEMMMDTRSNSLSRLVAYRTHVFVIELCM